MMNNLEDIINKYKLQYNKDKSYFRFNFQFECNASYYTFKNYLKQCSNNIKLVNIINLVNKVPIDSKDFIPIYEFLKSKSKNNNIIFYLDKRKLLIRFSQICAGCRNAYLYNTPVLFFSNGFPTFTDLHILDNNKLNRLLNNSSNDKGCDICYENNKRLHYFPICQNNLCVYCFYKLNSNNCPLCRNEF